VPREITEGFGRGRAEDEVEEEGGGTSPAGIQRLSTYFSRIKAATVLQARVDRKGVSDEEGKGETDKNARVGQILHSPGRQSCLIVRVRASVANRFHLSELVVGPVCVRKSEVSLPNLRGRKEE
jgi:hypothetical protein